MSKTSTAATLEKALAHARAHKDDDLKDLMEELRIPSVSALKQRHPDCVRNAEWLRDRFERMGFKAKVAHETKDGLPVVVADWNGAPGKPHLTIYGHYDVQPADPVDKWETPAFEPNVRNGNLFARGACDNKGDHMTALKAVEHIAASGDLPLNIRFLIEGEEESGGHALPQYLRAHAKELGTDAVLVWDGGFDELGRPVMATALRGILYVEIHARGAAIDLHSGSFGGNAPNPLNTLGRIVGALKDPNGHVTIPGFYDDVKPPTEAELVEWRKDDAEFQKAALRLTGARALEGEPGFLALERKGSRPTLDVNGMLGGFVEEGEKTVIPATAFAKVSMRLVPDQDWQKIFKSLEAYVQTLTTPGVVVDVERLGTAPPILSGADHPGALALQAAFEESFGRKTALAREGGSIPVGVDFQEAIGAPLIISGIGQADAAVHSPNEHLLISQYHTGIEALIRFICRFAESGAA
ncbi:MAG TPA: M20/M25/M40 family metallo-hydrolase [Candidatus Dormibacteraeota bacterium]|nr:M20/M25/M40 family metallo-hydrolase [Candidatus Dormibacteraeota bacterium]